MDEWIKCPPGMNIVARMNGQTRIKLALATPARECEHLSFADSPVIACVLIKTSYYQKNSDVGRVEIASLISNCASTDQIR